MAGRGKGGAGCHGGSRGGGAADEPMPDMGVDMPVHRRFCPVPRVSESGLLLRRTGFPVMSTGYPVHKRSCPVDRISRD